MFLHLFKNQYCEKKLILCLIFIPIISFFQEITFADYNKYVYNSDLSYLESVVSKYQAVLINVEAVGIRTYVATYVRYTTSISQKTSPLDVSNGNKVMSFEEFIPYEKERRIKRKEQLRIAAENERKKQIELKKKRRKL